MNNRKIALITEDEKEFGERCRVCLEEKGFEVEYTPRNGKELLRKIREENPAAVLMEVFMPELDALGVIREVLKEEGEQRPRLFTISSVDHAAITDELIRAGATYHFTRPLDPEMMAERMEAFAGFNPREPLLTESRRSSYNRKSAFPPTSRAISICGIPSCWRWRSRTSSTASPRCSIPP